MALRALSHIALAATLWTAGDAAAPIVRSSSSSSAAGTVTTESAGTVTINGVTTPIDSSSATITRTFNRGSPPSAAAECESLRICEKCVDGWAKPDTGKACPDSSFCNGAETCDEDAVCAAGTAVDCSDTPFGAIDAQCGRATCSETDKACKVDITPGNCDDGDACTDNDTCDPFTGACRGVPRACPAGETCSAGTCGLPATRSADVVPTSNAQSTCVFEICRNGVCSGGACPTCQVCSGGTCVPRVCAAGTVCVDDACTAASAVPPETPPATVPPPAPSAPRLRSPATIPDPLAECGATFCINGECSGGVCPTCEVCSGGTCVPRVCAAGRECVDDVCMSVSDEPPVTTTRSGRLPPSPPTIPDPLAECGFSVCVNGECSGGVCPTCEVCSGGQCVPRVCAAGRQCIDDACMNVD